MQNNFRKYASNLAYRLPLSIICESQQPVFYQSNLLTRPFYFEVFCPYSCFGIEIGIIDENGIAYLQNFKTTTQRVISVQVEDKVIFKVNNHNPISKKKQIMPKGKVAIGIRVSEKGNMAILNPFCFKESVFGQYVFLTHQILKGLQINTMNLFNQTQEILEEIATGQKCLIYQFEKKKIFYIDDKIRMIYPGFPVRTQNLFQDKPSIIIKKQQLEFLIQKFKIVKLNSLNFLLKNLNAFQYSQQYISFNYQTNQLQNFIYNASDFVIFQLRNNDQQKIFDKLVLLKLLKYIILIHQQIIASKFSSQYSFSKNSESLFLNRIYSTYYRLMSLAISNYDNVVELAKKGYYTKTNIIHTLYHFSNPNNLVAYQDKLMPSVQLQVFLNNIPYQNTIKNGQLLQSCNYSMIINSEGEFELWSSQVILLSLVKDNVRKKINKQKKNNKKLTRLKKQNSNQPISLKVTPNVDMLQTLITFGFTIQNCKKALIQCQNKGIEEAVDILMEFEKNKSQKQQPIGKAISDWNCQVCTYHNNQQQIQCKICQAKISQQLLQKQNIQNNRILQKTFEPSYYQQNKQVNNIVQFGTLIQTKLVQTQLALSPILILCSFKYKNQKKIRLIKLGPSQQLVEKFLKTQQEVYKSIFQESLQTDSNKELLAKQFKRQLTWGWGMWTSQGNWQIIEINDLIIQEDFLDFDNFQILQYDICNQGYILKINKENKSIFYTLLVKTLQIILVQNVQTFMKYQVEKTCQQTENKIYANGLFKINYYSTNPLAKHKPYNIYTPKYPKALHSNIISLKITNYFGSTCNQKYFSSSMLQGQTFISNYPNSYFLFEANDQRYMYVDQFQIKIISKKINHSKPGAKGLIFLTNGNCDVSFYKNFDKKKWIEYINSTDLALQTHQQLFPCAYYQIKKDNLKIRIQPIRNRPTKYILLYPTGSLDDEPNQFSQNSVSIDLFRVYGHKLNQSDYKKYLRNTIQFQRITEEQPIIYKKQTKLILQRIVTHIYKSQGLRLYTGSNNHKNAIYLNTLQYKFRGNLQNILGLQDLEWTIEQQIQTIQEEYKKFINRKNSFKARLISLYFILQNKIIPDYKELMSMILNSSHQFNNLMLIFQWFYSKNKKEISQYIHELFKNKKQLNKCSGPGIKILFQLMQWLNQPFSEQLQQLMMYLCQSDNILKQYFYMNLRKKNIYSLYFQHQHFLRYYHIIAKQNFQVNFNKKQQLFYKLLQSNYKININKIYRSINITMNSQVYVSSVHLYAVGEQRPRKIGIIISSKSHQNIFKYFPQYSYYHYLKYKHPFIFPINFSTKQINITIHHYSHIPFYKNKNDKSTVSYICQIYGIPNDLVKQKKILKQKEKNIDQLIDQLQRGKNVFQQIKYVQKVSGSNSLDYIYNMCLYCCEYLTLHKLKNVKICFIEKLFQIFIVKQSGPIFEYFLNFIQILIKDVSENKYYEFIFSLIQKYGVCNFEVVKQTFQKFNKKIHCLLPYIYYKLQKNDFNTNLNELKQLLYLVLSLSKKNILPIQPFISTQHLFAKKIIINENQIKYNQINQTELIFIAYCFLEKFYENQQISELIFSILENYDCKGQFVISQLQTKLTNLILIILKFNSNKLKIAMKKYLKQFYSAPLISLLTNWVLSSIQLQPQMNPYIQKFPNLKKTQFLQHLKYLVQILMQFKNHLDGIITKLINLVVDLNGINEEFFYSQQEFIWRIVVMYIINKGSNNVTSGQIISLLRAFAFNTQEIYLYKCSQIIQIMKSIKNLNQISDDLLKIVKKLIQENKHVQRYQFIQSICEIIYQQKIPTTICMSIFTQMLRQIMYGGKGVSLANAQMYIKLSITSKLLNICLYEQITLNFDLNTLIKYYLLNKNNLQYSPTTKLSTYIYQQILNIIEKLTLSQNMCQRIMTVAFNIIKSFNFTGEGWNISSYQQEAQQSLMKLIKLCIKNQKLAEIWLKISFQYFLNLLKFKTYSGSLPKQQQFANNITLKTDPKNIIVNNNTTDWSISKKGQKYKILTMIMGDSMKQAFIDLQLDREVQPMWIRLGFYKIATDFQDKFASIPSNVLVQTGSSLQNLKPFCVLQQYNDEGYSNYSIKTFVKNLIRLDKNCDFSKLSNKKFKFIRFRIRRPIVNFTQGYSLISTKKYENLTFIINFLSIIGHSYYKISRYYQNFISHALQLNNSNVLRQIANKQSVEKIIMDNFQSYIQHRYDLEIIILFQRLVSYNQKLTDWILERLYKKLNCQNFIIGLIISSKFKLKQRILKLNQYLFVQKKLNLSFMRQYPKVIHYATQQNIEIDTSQFQLIWIQGSVELLKVHVTLILPPLIKLKKKFFPVFQLYQNSHSQQICLLLSCMFIYDYEYLEIFKEKYLEKLKRSIFEQEKQFQKIKGQLILLNTIIQITGKLQIELEIVYNFAKKITNHDSYSYIIDLLKSIALIQNTKKMAQIILQDLFWYSNEKDKQFIQCLLLPILRIFKSKPINIIQYNYIEQRQIIQNNYSTRYLNKIQQIQQRISTILTLTQLNKIFENIETKEQKSTKHFWIKIASIKTWQHLKTFSLPFNQLVLFIFKIKNQSPLFFICHQLLTIQQIGINKSNIVFKGIQQLALQIDNWQLIQIWALTQQFHYQLNLQVYDERSPYYYMRANKVYKIPQSYQIQDIVNQYTGKQIYKLDEEYYKQFEKNKKERIMDIEIRYPLPKSNKVEVKTPISPIFKMFIELKGIQKIIEQIGLKIKLRENKQLKKWQLYIKELSAFSKISQEFVMKYLMKEQTIELLFYLLGGNSQKNQKQQKIIINNFYKCLQNILNKQKNLNLYKNIISGGGFQLILERIANTSKQKARIRNLNQSQQNTIKQQNASENNNSNNLTKKGIGYGGINTDWNVDKYVTAQKIANDELIIYLLVIQKILKYVSHQKQVVQKIFQSSLLPLIENNLRSANSLLQIAKDPNLFLNILNILEIFCEGQLKACLQKLPEQYQPRQSQSIFQLLQNLNKVGQVYLSINKSVDKIEAKTQHIAKKIICTYQKILKHINKKVNNVQQNRYKQILKKMRLKFISMKSSEGNYSHHFSSSLINIHSKQKSVRLSQEIASLTLSLPVEQTNSIFIRVDKEKIDLMKAIITGAQGTPYAHGCFVYDIYFDEKYPQQPPKMNLMTTGNNKIRFNPNLYNCGKVCLSLLGTWRGNPNQNWDPKISTLLQVLVSIQAVVMSEFVYFNEPSFEGQLGTIQGNKKNQGYSNIVRYGNIKYAMINNIKNPPQGFQEVIYWHFYLKRDKIIKDVQKWIEWSDSKQASYKGLVCDHNYNIVNELKNGQAYKMQLIKNLEILKELLNNLKQPQIRNEFKITEKIVKKKHKHYQQKNNVSIDVSFQNKIQHKQFDPNDQKVKNRWSRYIGAMGIQSVKKQAVAQVLLYGLSPFGLEIAKNLVLSGIRKLTINQPNQASKSQNQCNFYLEQKDKKKISVINKLLELNPYVIIEEYNQKTCDIHKIDVIVVSNYYGGLYQLSQFCHKNKIKFIYCRTSGICSYMFNDFGKAQYFKDEQIKSLPIKQITKGNKGIVKMIQGLHHQLQDQDQVIFQNVITSANGQSYNGQRMKIKVITFQKFQIESNQKFGQYQYGGTIRKIIKPVQIEFKSYKQNLEDKIKIDLKYYNGNKINEWSNIILAFKILDLFQRYYGQKPRAFNQQDLNKFMKLAKQDLELSKEKDLQEIKQFLMNFCMISQAQLGVICSFMGGFVAQEVIKAITQKYIPVNQFFVCDFKQLTQFFSSKSNLKEFISKRQVQSNQINRWNKLILGKQIVEQLQKLRLFCIGAGAIGCQLIKNMALLNVGVKGEIIITDPDHIQISNLNRQFLFRQMHLQKPKSLTAKAAAIQINPLLKNKIVAKLEKVHQDSEDIFTQQFFKSLDLVMNALDNITARKYVDKRCVLNQIPLIDSGTLGPKGHVQVILPFYTQSYGEQNDLTQQNQIPYCTIKLFPQQIIHCIQWALDKFNKLFCIQPKMIENAQQSKLLNVKGKSLQKIYKMLKNLPRNFEDCLRKGLKKFYKYFKFDILKLLKLYPKDKKNEDGSWFWKLPKRIPSPIYQFDQKDDLHLNFIFKVGIIYAKIYNIDYPHNFRQKICLDQYRQNIIKMMNPQLKKKGFKQKHNKIIKQQIEQFSHNQQQFEKKKLLIKNLFNQFKEKNKLNIQQFQKDQDSNGHIDVIWALTNLRAKCYQLPTIDWLNTKLKAGKIIPAMSTTTSVIAAYQTIQMIMVVKQKLNIQKQKLKVRNIFVNLSIPQIQIAEPGLLKKVKIGNKQVSIWDKWLVSSKDLNQEITKINLRQFIEFIFKKYQLIIKQLLHKNIPKYIANIEKKQQEKLMLQSKLIQILDIKNQEKSYQDLIVICQDLNKQRVTNVPIIRLIF